MNDKYFNKYINSSREDSLYSNGNENEKYHHHSRNFNNRNFFINYMNKYKYIALYIILCNNKKNLFKLLIILGIELL